MDEISHAASKPSQRQPRHAPGTIHNVAWNFLGLAAPLIAAIAAVPVLIAGLGLERFGVLTLAWAIIGYFSLFDLGLGRALTKLVAQRLGDGRDAENPAIIRTALLLLLALGSAAGALLALCAATLASDVLSVPAVMAKETQTALLVLAATVPVVFLCSALRGVLEAHQRFDIATLIRIPLGLWTFLGPLAVLPLSNRLDHVVLALAAGRVVALIAHCWACARVSGGGFAGANASRRLARDLLSFGGWVTVSNIISPFMVYFDRFVIGAMLAVAAVAHYATPFEVITKLGVIPSAVIGVLFATLSTTLSTAPERARAALSLGTKGVLLLMFMPVVFVVAFAREALALWIDPEFAATSYQVLQILALGVLVNAVATLPFTALQAAGRPDLTAKLHLAELPVYLAALFVLVYADGIRGAAVAWTLRHVLDVAALFWLCSRELPGTRTVARLSSAWLCGFVVLAAGAALVPSPAARLAYVIVASVAAYRLGWRHLLTASERDAAWTHLRRLPVPIGQ